MKSFSKSFNLFVLLTLVMVYLVFVVGSLVRITGSGMGCPDWPKCFGSWIPPKSVDELPSNYQEKYIEMRIKKVEKFSKLLSAFGMKDKAEELKNDPELYREETFNARKTWTEYVNRLVGFVAGNLMLFQFIIALFYFKKRKFTLLALSNLILIGLTGWLGSVVVASNLVPWTITLHMLLGVSIILIQVYILHYVKFSGEKKRNIPRYFMLLLTACFLITLYQIFLGTQVREQIDQLSIEGFSRQTWSEKLGIPYWIHRSFSWLVLIVIGILFVINEKQFKFTAIRWIFGLLTLALISGVFLAHLNIPAMVQTLHLMSATILLGIMFLFLLRSKKSKMSV